MTNQAGNFPQGDTILKNMRAKLTILLLAIVAGSAVSRAQGAEATSAQDAETVLKQFEGKTLILRHPLQSDSQSYDVEGEVLNGGKEGPWTVFGGVVIDRVALSPDTLRLEGRRIFFLFPKQKLVLFELTRRKHHKAPPISPSINVEVILNKPIDPAEALTVLNRIFALKTEDVLESLPDFWRAYLMDHHFSYDASQKKEAEYRWSVEVPKESGSVQNGQPDQIKDAKDEDFHDPVSYHVGPGSGVKAPKPKYTPEPAFSEIAQYENFQGIVVVNVVVGTDGKVHRIRLLRPLGMGLDEIARSTIETWRFQPATRNGQPVAVEMNIEVAFDQY